MNIEQETKNNILLQKNTDLDHMKTISVHITKDNWKRNKFKKENEKKCNLHRCFSCGKLNMSKSLEPLICI